LFTRYGTAAGSFEALHPLAQLRFVPDRPVLLAASSYGSLFAFDLEPDGSDGSLVVTERWRSHVLSSIGRLAITGDGGVILLSCYTHGLQRFDSEGRNEGTYHLDGTATLAVTDFAGKLVVAATTEGSLAILNPSGQVRWKAVLARGPVGLECDGLGQFVIYGLPSGEIVRLDLEASTAPTPRHEVADESDEGMTTGNLRAPKWRAAIARSDEQAETAVLAVLADPPRVIALTNRNRLQVFDEEGNDLGETPEVSGVGRVLRTAPGWVVAATDRHVLVLDAREGTARRLDLSLVELSHVGLRPADHGIVLIQEGDRIGRVSLAGRWVWKKELKSRVEDLALGSQAQTAVTNEAGELLVFDAAGAPSGRFAAEAPEPLALAAAPVGSPAGVCWITLARQAQVLRGHGADGRVIWESPVPWEAWQLHGLGSCVVVEAVDGRALAIEGSGHVIGRGRAESSGSLFHAGPDGSPRRLTVQGENLVVTDLDGRVRWRAIAGAEIGPRAAAANGVAVLLGRDLAWYPDTP
jgi:hypothetical protein